MGWHDGSFAHKVTHASCNTFLWPDGPGLNHNTSGLNTTNLIYHTIRHLVSSTCFSQGAQYTTTPLFLKFNDISESQTLKNTNKSIHATKHNKLSKETVQCKMYNAKCSIQNEIITNCSRKLLNAKCAMQNVQSKCSVHVRNKYSS